MHVLVVASGSMGPESDYIDIIKSADYIICADGGARYLLDKGIYPDLLLGDFDSIDQKQLELIRTKGCKIEEYPPEKNYTDSELALMYAIDLKPSKVTLLGVTGTRLDHSIANIHLLSKLETNNIKGEIINDNNKILYMDIAKEISLSKDNRYKYLSLIPLSSCVKSVSLEGVRYPLTKKDLYFSETLSISNEISRKKARITKDAGRLVVILASD